MEILLIIVLIGVGFGLSSSSSSGSSSRRGKETVVVQQQPTQQAPPQVIYQQAPPPQVIYQQAPPSQVMYQQAPSQTENIQENPAPKQQSAIRSFAVKSYSKIEADNKKGKGEYLSSLATLMESEGVPKAEALVLIKQALRKANGNAEIFGEQIEKFVE